MLRRNFARTMVLAATVLVLGLVLGWSAPPVLAQSLDQLRASGAVGERYDGYAEALQSGAAGVVQKVNAKRKQIYQQTADKEGASVDQIGRVYARQIFAKAPPGTKFLQENGSWIAKSRRHGRFPDPSRSRPRRARSGPASARPGTTMKRSRDGR